MRTLVIYDSVYGNTEIIARAIGDALPGEVQVLRVGQVDARELEAAYEQVRGELGRSFVFAAVGGPLYAAYDEQILRSDLQYTVTASLVGCALLLVAAFGSVLLPVSNLSAIAAGLVVLFQNHGLHPGILAVPGAGRQPAEPGRPAGIPRRRFGGPAAHHSC